MSTLKTVATTENKLALSDVSEEAVELYHLLDAQATEDWQPFTDTAPGNDTRQLLHELGSHRLLASYTVPATNIYWFSLWQNRYPAQEIDTILVRPQSIAKIVEHYSEWLPFSFDYFGMVLRQIGVQTEALYQINNAYLKAYHMGLLETQKHGREARVTQNALQWLCRACKESGSCSIPIWY